MHGKLNTTLVGNMNQRSENHKQVFFGVAPFIYDKCTRMPGTLLFNVYVYGQEHRQRWKGRERESDGTLWFEQQ